MDILGLEIGLLNLMQIVSTLVLIGGFSAMTASRQREAERASAIQTAILGKLLIDEHPKISSPTDIVRTRRDPPELIGTYKMAADVMQGGAPPSVASYTRPHADLIFTVLMPYLWLFPVVQFLHSNWRSRPARLETTAVRRIRHGQGNRYVDRFGRLPRHRDACGRKGIRRNSRPSSGYWAS